MLRGALDPVHLPAATGPCVGATPLAACRPVLPQRAVCLDMVAPLPPRPPECGGGRSEAEQVLVERSIGASASPADRQQQAVFAWGEGEDGQLGIETVPRPSAGDEGLETFLCTPTWVVSTQHLQLRSPEFGRFPAVAGSRNSLCLAASGEVYTWGWNQRGTLGHGHKKMEREPCKVAALAHVKIVQASIGGWHCLCLTDQGNVYAFGGNEYNQCALQRDSRERAERDVCVPTQILPSLKVRQVAAGGMHSVALTMEGEVWAWGQPLCDFNNVQQRQPSPVLLPTSSQVVKVASGAFHNLALQANGQVLAWGRNEYGSLGLGDTVFMSNPTAINYFVDHAVKVMDITCGGWHTAAITTEGDMYVWGRGEHGRLGLGDERGASKLLPTLLELPDGERVKQVSCGGSHTLFLTTSRKVMTCGRGSFGRQNNADMRTMNKPVYVKFDGGHWKGVSVSAGGRHSIAVMELMKRRSSIASFGRLNEAGHFEPVVEPDDERDEYHVDLEVE